MQGTAIQSDSTLNVDELENKRLDVSLDVPQIIIIMAVIIYPLYIVQDDHDPDNKKECPFDWWSKYHASGHDDSKIQQKYIDDGYDVLKVEIAKINFIACYTSCLQIYDTELEKSFGLFEDFAITFPLYRGKGARNSNENNGQICGYLKGNIKVYPVLPDRPEPEGILSSHSLPSISPVECVVRVYVVKVSKLFLYLCVLFKVYYTV